MKELRRTHRHRASRPSCSRATVQQHSAPSAAPALLPSPQADVSLHHADCFKVLPSIPAASIDLILCDLPYGTASRGVCRQRIASDHDVGITHCKWDKKIALPELWSEYLRILKPDGAIVLTACGSFAKRLQASAPKNLYRYEWIWDKKSCTGFVNAHRMPMVRHENVLVFYRSLPTYNPQGLRAVDAKPRPCRHSGVYGKIFGRAGYRQRFTGYPNSILQIPRGSGLAACEKPVELMRYFIRTYTKPGEIVLDNCMGLGSTGIAAKEEGRAFIGIESDRARFATARSRIVAATRRTK